MIQSDEDDDLVWIQIDTTAEGYPVFECIERPGIQRISVPNDVWRKLYGERGLG